MAHDFGRSRPRRLRQNPAIRSMVRETRLSPERLVLPVFVHEGSDVRPIEALPGCSRLPLDGITAIAEQALALGIRSVALFPQVRQERKTRDALEALNEDNLTVRAVRTLRRALPELCIITDIALDPYSSDGHDGLVSDSGEILNDETVEILAQMAVLHAGAGADMVAPSDMMDGRVGAIRDALDAQGHHNTMILSYAVKYASAFYGPFREALDSAPVERPGIPRTKCTYQMDPANSREALVEAAIDELEGADILMVKPGLLYLDVIARLREATSLPLAAYHVSGEYAMLKAAAQRGWLDERKALSEMLLSLARAGADIILTYGALDYARWWGEEMRR
jgi:porphobilinogen synthase